MTLYLKSHFSRLKARPRIHARLIKDGTFGPILEQTRSQSPRKISKHWPNVWFSRQNQKLIPLRSVIVLMRSSSISVWTCVQRVTTLTNAVLLFRWLLLLLTKKIAGSVNEMDHHQETSSRSLYILTEIELSTHSSERHGMKVDSPFSTLHWVRNFPRHEMILFDKYILFWLYFCSVKFGLT